jgi:hypothetical protein
MEILDKKQSNEYTLYSCEYEGCAMCSCSLNSFADVMTPLCKSDPNYPS